MKVFIIIAILILNFVFSNIYSQEKFPNIYTGKLVPLQEYFNQQIPAWAITNWDSRGNPYVRYSYTYNSFSSVMKKFVRLHEKEHARGNKSEVDCNCIALIEMRVDGLTEKQENEIANFHINAGSIGPQYGGTGREFWERTIDCAGPRSY